MRRKDRRRRYPMAPIYKPAVGTFVVTSFEITRDFLPIDDGVFRRSLPWLMSASMTLASTGPINPAVLVDGGQVVVTPVDKGTR